MQVELTLTLGLIIEAAAAQVDGLATCSDAPVRYAEHCRALLGHAHRDIFFRRSFSNFKRPISANSFSGSYPPGMAEDAVGVNSKTPAAFSANCFFHAVIWEGATSYFMASSAKLCRSLLASKATLALNSGVNFRLAFLLIVGQC